MPRPETEELVELIVIEYGKDRTAGNKPGFSILDVGTGSGVIALSLAMKLPEAEIKGVDISEDALNLAKENAGRLGMNGRVEFSQGDLLEGFSERFDVIVANLPYIAMTDRGSLSPEVQRDPEIALFGGERGDEIIQRLIVQASDRLVPGGLLALEIGETQTPVIAESVAQKKYKDMTVKNDYSGKPRFVLARYG